MAFIKSLTDLLRRSNKVISINIRKCSVDVKYKEKTCVPDTDFVQRLLKVAVIGMPNVGKSTFINFLMDRKVICLLTF